MPENNKNKKTQSEKPKGRKALNCLIGILALSGSVGTITFGTLWCQERKTPEQENVKLNKTSLTLDVNASEQLFVMVDPIGCSQDVIWSSDNKTVADVDTDGNVVAKNVGTATITVKAAHCDSFATCFVTVRDVPIPPEPTILNLDQFQQDPYGEGLQDGILSTTNQTINKDQKIALITEMKNVVGIDKTAGLLYYFVTIAGSSGGELYYPTFYGGCEFYIDDNLIPPDQYIFSSSAAGEGCNFYLWTDSLSVAIDCDKSVFKMVITPYSEITPDVTFNAYCSFDPW